MISINVRCKLNNDNVTLEYKKDGKKSTLSRKIFLEELSQSEKDDIKDVVRKYLQKISYIMDSRYDEDLHGRTKEEKDLEDNILSFDFFVKGGIYQTRVYESFRFIKILSPTKTEIPVEIEFKIIASYHLLSNEYINENSTVKKIIIVCQDDGKFRVKQDMDEFLVTPKYILSKIKNRNEYKILYNKLRIKWKV